MQIIKEARSLKVSEAERLQLILQGSLYHSSQLEVALRAWVHQDLMAQCYQQRFAYLAELIFLLCHDREQAHRTSQVIYCIFVGSQQFLPPVQGKDLEALYQEVARISDFLLWPAEDKPTCVGYQNWCL